MKKSNNNKEEKKLKNPSEFLAGLKKTLENGDKMKGSDVIKQINEIAKKSENVDLEKAEKNMIEARKNIDPLSNDDLEKIENYYNEYISHTNKEDTMFAQVALINNIQSDIVNAEREYKKIVEKLEKNHFLVMGDLVTELKEKESNFKEEYGDDEYEKYFS